MVRQGPGGLVATEARLVGRAGTERIEVGRGTGRNKQLSKQVGWGGLS